MLSARESEGESHLEVELPVIIGTIPLRRSYGMVNKLIPATRLTRSYSGECKTFVTIKRVTLESGIHSNMAITT